MGPDSLSLGEEAVWMQYGCVCVNTVHISGTWEVAAAWKIWGLSSNSGMSGS